MAITRDDTSVLLATDGLPITALNQVQPVPITFWVTEAGDNWVTEASDNWITED